MHSYQPAPNKNPTALRYDVRVHVSVVFNPTVVLVSCVNDMFPDDTLWHRVVAPKISSLVDCLKQQLGRNALNLCMDQGHRAAVDAAFLEVKSRECVVPAGSGVSMVRRAAVSTLRMKKLSDEERIALNAEYAAARVQQSPQQGGAGGGAAAAGGASSSSSPSSSAAPGGDARRGGDGHNREAYSARITEEITAAMRDKPDLVALRPFETCTEGYLAAKEKEEEDARRAVEDRKKRDEDLRQRLEDREKARKKLREEVELLRLEQMRRKKRHQQMMRSMMSSGTAGGDNDAEDSADNENQQTQQQQSEQSQADAAAGSSSADKENDSAFSTDETVRLQQQHEQEEAAAREELARQAQREQEIEEAERQRMPLPKYHWFQSMALPRQMRFNSIAQSAMLADLIEMMCDYDHHDPLSVIDKRPCRSEGVRWRLVHALPTVIAPAAGSAGLILPIAKAGNAALGTDVNSSPDSVCVTTFVLEWEVPASWVELYESKNKQRHKQRLQQQLEEEEDEDEDGGDEGRRGGRGAGGEDDGGGALSAAALARLAKKGEMQKAAAAARLLQQRETLLKVNQQLAQSLYVMKQLNFIRGKNMNDVRNRSAAFLQRRLSTLPGTVHQRQHEQYIAEQQQRQLQRDAHRLQLQLLEGIRTWFPPKHAKWSLAQTRLRRKKMLRAPLSGDGTGGGGASSSSSSSSSVLMDRNERLVAAVARVGGDMRRIPPLLFDCLALLSDVEIGKVQAHAIDETRRSPMMWLLEHAAQLPRELVREAAVTLLDLGSPNFLCETSTVVGGGGDAIKDKTEADEAENDQLGDELVSNKSRRKRGGAGGGGAAGGKDEDAYRSVVDVLRGSEGSRAIMAECQARSMSARQEMPALRGAVLDIPPGRCRFAAFSATKENVVYTISPDGRLLLWDLRARTCVQMATTGPGARCLVVPLFPLTRKNQSVRQRLSVCHPNAECDIILLSSGEVLTVDFASISGPRIDLAATTAVRPDLFEGDGQGWCCTFAWNLQFMPKINRARIDRATRVAQHLRELGARTDILRSEDEIRNRNAASAAASFSEAVTGLASVAGGGASAGGGAAGDSKNISSKNKKDSSGGAVSSSTSRELHIEFGRRVILYPYGISQALAESFSDGRAGKKKSNREDGDGTGGAGDAAPMSIEEMTAQHERDERQKQTQHQQQLQQQQHEQHIRSSSNLSNDNAEDNFNNDGGENVSGGGDGDNNERRVGFSSSVSADQHHQQQSFQQNQNTSNNNEHDAELVLGGGGGKLQDGEFLTPIGVLAFVKDSQPIVLHLRSSIFAHLHVSASVTRRARLFAQALDESLQCVEDERRRLEQEYEEEQKERKHNNTTSRIINSNDNNNDSVNDLSTSELLDEATRSSSELPLSSADVQQQQSPSTVISALAQSSRNAATTAQQQQQQGQNQNQNRSEEENAQRLRHPDSFGLACPESFVTGLVFSASSVTVADPIVFAMADGRLIEYRCSNRLFSTFKSNLKLDKLPQDGPAETAVFRIARGHATCCVVAPTILDPFERKLAAARGETMSSSFLAWCGKDFAVSTSSVRMHEGDFIKEHHVEERNRREERRREQLQLQQEDEQDNGRRDVYYGNTNYSDNNFNSDYYNDEEDDEVSVHLRKQRAIYKRNNPDEDDVEMEELIVVAKQHRLNNNTNNATSSATTAAAASAAAATATGNISENNNANNSNGNGNDETKNSENRASSTHDVGAGRRGSVNSNNGNANASSSSSSSFLPPPYLRNSVFEPYVTVPDDAADSERTTGFVFPVLLEEDEFFTHLLIFARRGELCALDSRRSSRVLRLLRMEATETEITLRKRLGDVFDDDSTRNSNGGDDTATLSSGLKICAVNNTGSLLLVTCRDFDSAAVFPTHVLRDAIQRSMTPGLPPRHRELEVVSPLPPPISSASSAAGPLQPQHQKGKRGKGGGAMPKESLLSFWSRFVCPDQASFASKCQHIGFFMRLLEIAINAKPGENAPPPPAADGEDSHHQQQHHSSSMNQLQLSKLHHHHHHQQQPKSKIKAGSVGIHARDGKGGTIFHSFSSILLVWDTEIFSIDVARRWLGILMQHRVNFWIPCSRVRPVDAFRSSANVFGLEDVMQNENDSQELYMSHQTAATLHCDRNSICKYEDFINTSANVLGEALPHDAKTMGAQIVLGNRGHIFIAYGGALFVMVLASTGLAAAASSSSSSSFATTSTSTASPRRSQSAPAAARSSAALPPGQQKRQEKLHFLCRLPHGRNVELTALRHCGFLTESKSDVLLTESGHVIVVTERQLSFTEMLQSEVRKRRAAGKPIPTSAAATLAAVAAAAPDASSPSSRSASAGPSSLVARRASSAGGGAAASAGAGGSLMSSLFNRTQSSTSSAGAENASPVSSGSPSLTSPASPTAAGVAGGGAASSASSSQPQSPTSTQQQKKMYTTWDAETFSISDVLGEIFQEKYNGAECGVLKSAIRIVERMDAHQKEKDDRAHQALAASVWARNKKQKQDEAEQAAVAAASSPPGSPAAAGGGAAKRSRGFGRFMAIRASVQQTPLSSMPGYHQRTLTCFLSMATRERNQQEACVEVLSRCAVLTITARADTTMTAKELSRLLQCALRESLQSSARSSVVATRFSPDVLAEDLFLAEGATLKAPSTAQQRQRQQQQQQQQEQEERNAAAAGGDDQNRNTNNNDSSNDADRTSSEKQDINQSFFTGVILGISLIGCLNQRLEPVFEGFSWAFADERRQLHVLDAGSWPTGPCRGFSQHGMPPRMRNTCTVKTCLTPLADVLIAICRGPELFVLKRSPRSVYAASLLLPVLHLDPEPDSAFHAEQVQCTWGSRRALQDQTNQQPNQQYQQYQQNQFHNNASSIVRTEALYILRDGLLLCYDVQTELLLVLGKVTRTHEEFERLRKCEPAMRSPLFDPRISGGTDLLVWDDTHEIAERREAAAAAAVAAQLRSLQLTRQRAAASAAEGSRSAEAELVEAEHLHEQIVQQQQQQAQQRQRQQQLAMMHYHHGSYSAFAALVFGPDKADSIFRVSVTHGFVSALRLNSDSVTSCVESDAPPLLLCHRHVPSRLPKPIPTRILRSFFAMRSITMHDRDRDPWTSYLTEVCGQPARFSQQHDNGSSNGSSSGRRYGQKEKQRKGRQDQLEDDDVRESEDEDEEEEELSIVEQIELEQQVAHSVQDTVAIAREARPIRSAVRDGDGSLPFFVFGEWLAKKTNQYYHRQRRDADSGGTSNTNISNNQLLILEQRAVLWCRRLLHLGHSPYLTTPSGRSAIRAFAQYLDPLISRIDLEPGMTRREVSIVHHPVDVILSSSFASPGGGGDDRGGGVSAPDNVFDSIISSAMRETENQNQHQNHQQRQEEDEKNKKNALNNTSASVVQLTWSVARGGVVYILRDDGSLSLAKFDESSILVSSNDFDPRTHSASPARDEDETEEENNETTNTNTNKENDNHENDEAEMSDINNSAVLANVVSAQQANVAEQEADDEEAIEPIPSLASTGIESATMRASSQCRAAFEHPGWSFTQLLPPMTISPGESIFISAMRDFAQIDLMRRSEPPPPPSASTDLPTPTTPSSPPGAGASAGPSLLTWRLAQVAEDIIFCSDGSLFSVRMNENKTFFHATAERLVVKPAERSFQWRRMAEEAAARYFREETADDENQDQTTSSTTTTTVTVTSAADNKNQNKYLRNAGHLQNGATEGVAAHWHETMSCTRDGVCASLAAGIEAPCADVVFAVRRLFAPSGITTLFPRHLPAVFASSSSSSSSSSSQQHQQNQSRDGLLSIRLRAADGWCVPSLTHEHAVSDHARFRVTIRFLGSTTTSVHTTNSSSSSTAAQPGLSSSPSFSSPPPSFSRKATPCISKWCVSGGCYSGGCWIVEDSPQHGGLICKAKLQFPWRAAANPSSSLSPSSSTFSPAFPVEFLMCRDLTIPESFASVVMAAGFAHDGLSTGVYRLLPEVLQKDDDDEDEHQHQHDASLLDEETEQQTELNLLRMMEAHCDAVPPLKQQEQQKKKNNRQSTTQHDLSSVLCFGCQHPHEPVVVCTTRGGTQLVLHDWQRETLHVVQIAQLQQHKSSKKNNNKSRSKSGGRFGKNNQQPTSAALGNQQQQQDADFIAKEQDDIALASSDCIVRFSCCGNFVSLHWLHLKRVTVYNFSEMLARSTKRPFILAPRSDKVHARANQRFIAQMSIASSSSTSASLAASPLLPSPVAGGGAIASGSDHQLLIDTRSSPNSTRRKSTTFAEATSSKLPLFVDPALSEVVSVFCDAARMGTIVPHASRDAERCSWLHRAASQLCYVLAVAAGDGNDNINDNNSENNNVINIITANGYEDLQLDAIVKSVRDVLLAIQASCGYFCFNIAQSRPFDDLIRSLFSFSFSSSSSSSSSLTRFAVLLNPIRETIAAWAAQWSAARQMRPAELSARQLIFFGRDGAAGGGAATATAAGTTIEDDNLSEDDNVEFLSQRQHHHHHHQQNENDDDAATFTGTPVCFLKSLGLALSLTMSAPRSAPVAAGFGGAGAGASSSSKQLLVPKLLISSSSTTSSSSPASSSKQSAVNNKYVNLHASPEAQSIATSAATTKRRFLQAVAGAEPNQPPHQHASEASSHASLASAPSGGTRRRLSLLLQQHSRRGSLVSNRSLGGASSDAGGGGGGDHQSAGGGTAAGGAARGGAAVSMTSSFSSSLSSSPIMCATLCCGDQSSFLLVFVSHESYEGFGLVDLSKAIAQQQQQRAWGTRRRDGGEEEALDGETLEGDDDDENASDKISTGRNNNNNDATANTNTNATTSEYSDETSQQRQSRRQHRRQRRRRAAAAAAAAAASSSSPSSSSSLVSVIWCENLQELNSRPCAQCDIGVSRCPTTAEPLISIFLHYSSRNDFIDDRVACATMRVPGLFRFHATSAENVLTMIASQFARSASKSQSILPQQAASTASMMLMGAAGVGGGGAVGGGAGDEHANSMIMSMSRSMSSSGSAVAGSAPSSPSAGRRRQRQKEDKQVVRRIVACHATSTVVINFASGRLSCAVPTSSTSSSSSSLSSPNQQQHASSSSSFSVIEIDLFLCFATALRDAETMKKLNQDESAETTANHEINNNNNKNTSEKFNCDAIACLGSTIVAAFSCLSPQSSSCLVVWHVDSQRLFVERRAQAPLGPDVSRVEHLAMIPSSAPSESQQFEQKHSVSSSSSSSSSSSALAESVVIVYKSSEQGDELLCQRTLRLNDLTLVSNNSYKTEEEDEENDDDDDEEENENETAALILESSTSSSSPQHQQQLMMSTMMHLRRSIAEAPALVRRTNQGMKIYQL